MIAAAPSTSDRMPAKIIQPLTFPSLSPPLNAVAVIVCELMTSSLLLSWAGALNVGAAARPRLGGAGRVPRRLTRKALKDRGKKLEALPADGEMPAGWQPAPAATSGTDAGVFDAGLDRRQP